MIAEVLAGLAVNGLTAISKNSIAYVKDRRRKRPLLPLDTLDIRLIRDRIVLEAGSIPGLTSARTSESVLHFLQSQTALQLVQQLYSAKLAGMETSYSDQIKSSFDKTLDLFISRRVSTAKLEEDLYSAIDKACDIALDTALNQSNVDLTSLARNRLIVEHLRSIEVQISFLASQSRTSLLALQSWEAKYREQLAVVHGTIRPPSVHGARRVAIDELYVSPNFGTLTSNASDTADSWGLSELSRNLHRTVVLGSPGGGKSTLAKKLCYDIASQSQESYLADRSLTPVLIVLRDYAKRKSEERCSIQQFVEEDIQSTYQMPVPSGAFEFLLSSGKAFVVFDGLDELLDPHQREEVTVDVEAFCNLHPAVPVLVTSRRVGYDEAPLDRRIFSVFELKEFTEEQVKTYTERWFGTDLDLTPPQQRQLSEAFMRESSIVQDLRSNALLLSLMCSIYRAENYIPRNRPEVYEKCARMLFEQWDKSRGILSAPLVEADMELTLSFVAHWMFSEDLSSGVTRGQLVTKSAEFLTTWIEDGFRAYRASEDFIDFCRGRAWVLTDVGTTKDSEVLYQFTHRTFLEYYTAAFLVRTEKSPRSLVESLIPRLSLAEWDMVGQLAIQIKSRHLLSAADEMLEALTDAASRKEGMERLNLLYFAGRTLGFLRATPNLVRSLISMCLQTIIEFGERASGDEDFEARQRNTQLLEAITSESGDNRFAVSDAVKTFLLRYCNDPSVERPELACDILFRLSNKTIPSEFWSRAEGELSTELHDRIREVTLKSNYCVLPIMMAGVVSPQEVVRAHGLGTLFRPEPSLMFNSQYISAVELVIVLNATQLWEDQALRARYNLEAMESELGMFIEDQREKWLDVSWLEDWNLSAFIEANMQAAQADHSSLRTFNSQFPFTTLALLCALAEAGHKDDPGNLEATNLGQLNPFRPLLSARWRGVKAVALKELVPKVELSPQQHEMLMQWVSRRIDFVKGGHRRRFINVLASRTLRY